MASYINGNTISVPASLIDGQVLLANFKNAGGSSALASYNTASHWEVATTFGGTVYAQEGASSSDIRFQAVAVLDDYYFVGWKILDYGASSKLISSIAPLWEIPYFWNPFVPLS